MPTEENIYDLLNGRFDFQQSYEKGDYYWPNKTATDCHIHIKVEGIDDKKYISMMAITVGNNQGSYFDYYKKPFAPSEEDIGEKIKDMPQALKVSIETKYSKMVQVYDKAREKEYLYQQVYP